MGALSRSDGTPTGLVLGIPNELTFLVIGCEQRGPALREALAALSPVTWHDARDGREALVRIAEAPPDLLIVDAGDARVLDLCRALKSQVMSSTIGVIAIGGNDEARLDAIDAGCDHWLPASFCAGELHSRTLHLLRTRGLFRSLFGAHDRLRQRRDWVSYLVHDLRNGLSTVISNFDYVAETTSDRSEETSTALKEATFSARRMAALLQDMLDLDRFQRGELRARPSRFDVAQLLAQAAADVRLIARARGYELRVVASPLSIDADRGLLERVLANLLGNALRYARAAIRIGAEADGAVVRIVVANDGPPVPAEARARIFQPFIQLDGGQAGGAGLGLAFCRLALKAHGGTIELGDLGDGDAGEVAFVVTLPRSAAR